jgi:putative oxidoreductase
MTDRSLAWTKASPYLLSILRIVSGLLFMQHGAQKLFGLLGGTPVHWLSLMGLAGALEFFGGLLVVVGLFTRPVAFILAGEMAFAYFMVHGPSNFWPLLNGGDLAVMFCFAFLYLSAAGAGPWSVDRLLHPARRG